MTKQASLWLPGFELSDGLFGDNDNTATLVAIQAESAPVFEEAETTLPPAEIPQPDQPPVELSVLETEPTVESEFDGGPVQIITSLVARRAQVATATRSGAPWPVLTPSVHQNLVGVVKKFEANVNAISVLRELEANNTPPDADQRAALNQYTGWGGIKQPFDVCVHPDWVERALKLKSLLSEDEFGLS